MKTILFRPIRLASLGFALILVAFLLIVGVMTWTQSRRLERGRTHIQRLQTFQRAFLKLADAAADRATAPSPAEVHDLEGLLGDLDDLVHSAESHDVDTSRKIDELKALLERGELTSGSTWADALGMFRDIVSAEAESQERLLADMERETRTELWLTVAAPLALAGVGGLMMLFVRRRILRPLDGLGFLVSRLAQGEFTPVPVGQVDPMLHSLFANYNQLVMRLEELEQEHRIRAESLEREVRMATKALLEQQQGLARAERLAATGELAASVAHELRNPLASIQLTLANLKRELEDPDKVDRIDLVTGELTRLDRLLGALLDRSRHAPEQPRSHDLGESVRQLLALTRYQIPGRVRLESRVADGLICHLPEDRLRQALLNLILNAARAFGEAGGTIDVSARSEGRTLHVTVCDDGPGFPVEVLRRIPHPFLSTAESGTGLGLTIVHRFARDLGGELQLSNREPHGACAALTLPDCVNHG